MSRIPTKLGAANDNTANVAASFVTINATSKKAFQVRSIIQNVKPATLSDAVKALTENILSDPAPASHLIGNSVTASSVAAAGLPFNPFHAVRFAISQSFSSVINNEKAPNHDTRVLLLVALVDYAFKQPNFASLLGESFSSIPPKPKGFDFSADAIISNCTAFGIILPHQWAIAIGQCYSTADSSKAEGRRLLERLASATVKKGEGLTITCLTEAGLGEEHLSTLFYLTNSFDVCPPTIASFRNEYNNRLSVLHAPTFKDCVSRLSQSFSLAGLIEELGPNCVASHQDCMDMLEMVPALAPRHVAECLALFTSPSPFGSNKDANAYNSLRASLQLGDSKPPAAFPTNSSPTFVAAVKEKFPKLNWTEVLQALDNPNIRIERFASIAAAYKKATPDHNLPCEAFLGRWKNSRIQSQALKFMLESPDLVDFPVSKEVQATQGRGHVHQHVNNALRTLPENLSATATVCPGFGCLDFVESIVYCASRDHELEKILAVAMKDAPALIFAGLVCSRPQGTLHHLSLAAAILQQSGPAAALTDGVAQHLVKEGLTSLVVGLFGDLISNDTARYVEVIETLTHSQLVPAVLSANANLKLIVGCAIAGRETRQTPENWFQEHLGEKRESIPSSASEGSNRFAVAAALLEVCEELINKQKFVGSTTHALKELFASSVAATLPAIAGHAKVLLDSGDSAFPADVEADANTLFRTFIEPSNANKISPITECEKLYKSENPRDKQLFSCVVHILFEECKAIGSYPWSSLTAAARLFGQLVDRNLLTNQRVQMALQFIHTAISKNDQRATEFGIMALECFYKRLEEWPHYGKQLRAIENVYLDMRIPGVMAVVNRSLKQRRKTAEEAEAAKEEAGKDKPAAEAHSSKDIGLHQHDISILMNTEDKFSVPGQIIQDQINFLVGNTDPTRLATNAQELRRLVVPEFYPYFADYFVIKRVSLEPNFHSMYLDLLTAIDAKELDKAVRVATVKAVDKIFKSDKIRTEASERTLLKNLGSWYGQITLARNIPVLAREVNFKAMLHDALRTGKLIAVVPFIAKILEHIVGPKCIFRPPNPWTMCQLEHLLDVYALRDLRITLRFEVEVLLKNIGVKPDDIIKFARETRGVIPRNYVSIADIRETMDASGSYDFRADDANNAMYSQGGITIRQSSTPPPKSTRLTADAAPYQPQRLESLPIPPYPTVALNESTVVVTDDARYFSEEKLPAYRNAIVKILDPVLAHFNTALDRIASVATSTTLSVVLKDFPMDSDPNLVLRACTAFARSLAANLCINLRETLHAKILQYVEYLASQVVKDNKNEGFHNLKETIYRNNFNVVMRVLEGQAAERAVTRIRQALSTIQSSPDYYNRFRLSPEEQVIMSPAPDVLRSRPANAEQRAVYEDFFNMIPVLELVNAKIKSIEESSAKHFEKSVTSEALQSVFAPNFFNENGPALQTEVRDRLNEIKSNCAPDTASIIMRAAFTRIMPFAARMAVNEPPLSKAAVIVRESLLFTLVCARHVGGQAIVNEFTEMYLSENDRWKSYQLTVEFVRHNLLDIAALDSRLAADLSNTTTVKTRMTEFVRLFLDITVLGNPRLLLVTDIPKTVEALKSRAAAASAATVVPGEYTQKVTSIRLYSLYAADEAKAGMRAEIKGYLDEWVKIVQDRFRPDLEPGKEAKEKDADYRRRSMEFMERLQRKNMLKSLMGGHLDCMIGTMLELSVEHFATASLAQERHAKGPARPSESDLFQRIDAFNDLLQVLLRCCNTSNNSDAAPNASPPEVNLIAKIVSVVNKVLSHNHDHTLNRVEAGKDAAGLQQQLIADGNRAKLPEEEAYQVLLMQRPYVRFLSNLMTANFRASDQSHQQQIIADETLRVILETLNQLNPHVRPAFAFGWLELVCHRLLLPRVMRAPSKDAYASIAQNPRRHWIRYANLLVAGLKFLDPFTKNPEGIPTPVLMFFRSFLKLMLVILHDFPEYILHTNYLLCDYIPSCCIQLRNVVLCAFPNTIRLPDPFKYNTSQPNADNDTPPECPDFIGDNLKDIVSNDDIQRMILSNNTSGSRQEVSRLVEKLVDVSAMGSRKWNISAINSLVVTIALKQLTLTNQESRMTPHNPAFKIYLAMADSMDNEGRYYLINAFVNQLRFPNSHTRFFSALVLAFFLPVEEASQRTIDVIQEQILRVIVERLVAPRPHPWGLLVTFVDLFREDKYKVWTKACIRCSPDVERTITQLAKTISNEPPR